MNEAAPAGSQATDAAVIARSISEPSAFSTVFERHFSLVYRFLTFRVGERVAADLASETFAVAFRRRADYDRTRADARPWLLGIAISLAREQWRKERRLKGALVRFPRERNEEPHEEIAERLDALASGPALRSVLLELSSEELDLLILFASVELSYQEIAETLLLPIGTVRSRIHRLRLKLRGRLDLSAQEVST